MFSCDIAGNRSIIMEVLLKRTLDILYTCQMELTLIKGSVILEFMLQCIIAVLITSAICVINTTRIFRVIFYASSSTGIKPSLTHAFTLFPCLEKTRCALILLTYHHGHRMYSHVCRGIRILLSRARVNIRIGHTSVGATTTSYGAREKRRPPSPSTRYTLTGGDQVGHQWVSTASLAPPTSAHSLVLVLGCSPSSPLPHPFPLPSFVFPLPSSPSPTSLPPPPLYPGIKCRKTSRHNNIHVTLVSNRTRCFLYWKFTWYYDFVVVFCSAECLNVRFWWKGLYAS